LAASFIVKYFLGLFCLVIWYEKIEFDLMTRTPRYMVLKVGRERGVFESLELAPPLRRNI
jgi:hypothetical protein